MPLDQNQTLPAPEDLEGEALLEWVRLTAELEAAGRLKAVDRAVLVLWCNTWSVWKSVTKHVQKFGPIVPAANKVIGRSPWYQVQRECAIQLAKLADQMGITCRTRDYDRETDDTPQDLV